MFEVVILAVALSMDAFAVSIGLGSKQVQHTKFLALMSGVYFGLFQGIMPLIGYLGGKSVLTWLDAYAQWIAFILLVLIGLKMIHESKNVPVEGDTARITHKLMLILAIATSIDAMAAGFTLNLLVVSPFLACGIIGATTLILSFCGVFIGAQSGTWLETKAELFGGIVLVLIGFKMLLF